MILNTDSQKLGFLDTVCETTAEQSFDADINLPDYCPEIQRVLKCTLSPNVMSVQNSSGRVTADVSVVLRLIYVGDNGVVSGYDQSYPMQKIIDSSKIDSACAVTVRVNTDYLNCRAVNSRRLEAKGMLTFIFKAEKKRDENLLCNAEGAGIQLKSEDLSVSSLVGVTERTFSLGEVIEIPNDKKSVGTIMNISSFVEASELKMINNKALLKGNCSVKIYYLTDENCSVEYVEHSMPISQIIELDGLDDECISTYKLSVCSDEAIVKADSSGNMRLIDINLRVCVFLAAFEEKDVTLINDSYSVDYESENNFKTTELLQMNDSFNTSFTNKVVLESIGVSVDCVYGVWCNDLKYSFNAKDDKCCVSGSYNVTVIYKDSDGQTGVISKPVDFDSSIKIKNKSERLFTIGCAQISGCSCVATGDSRLELKTEIIANGIVFSSVLKKYVSNIQIKNESPEKNNPCALTVYYCDKGESIWNIARRYNTTVDAVMIENELTDEIITECRMILIPNSK